jgi:hypothetical protein
MQPDAPDLKFKHQHKNEQRRQEPERRKKKEERRKKNEGRTVSRARTGRDRKGEDNGYFTT